MAKLNNLVTDSPRFTQLEICDKNEMKIVLKLNNNFQVELCLLQVICHIVSVGRN